MYPDAPSLWWVLYLCRFYQCGLHAVHWSHIGVLRRLLVKELAVPQDLYSPLRVPEERSCCPCIRWSGTGGFQEQGQCFISMSGSIDNNIVFYYLYRSLLSVYMLVLWVGVFGLIGCRSLSRSLSLPTSFNNNIDK